MIFPVDSGANAYLGHNEVEIGKRRVFGDELSSLIANLYSASAIDEI
jgi:hypothetical protein